MKIAFVHDFLLSYGGAERVLEQAHELFPDAPIYTLRYDSKKIHDRMTGWDIRTSVIEKIPPIKKRGHTLAMPLYPFAVEQFDLSQYEVVISFSSSFVHGVITQPNTIHINYFHTPTRFLWDYYFPYLEERGWNKGLKGTVVKRLFHQLRQWDWLAAQRPDICLSNSATVQDRVKKFYHRESQVLYPGIDLEAYQLNEKHGDYFVTLSRLTKPKKIDLAVQACTKLKLPLRVIGGGEELEYLKDIAGPTISFSGFLSDLEVAEQLKGSRALLWPGIDDFGLVPIEAMACGTPVIALAEGGATETVIDNKTGTLFTDQSVEGLIKGIKKFESVEPSLNHRAIRQQAEKFSKQIFQSKLKQLIEQAYEQRSH